MPKGIYKRTKEMGENMSKARKGILHSEDHKRKISEALKGEKNPFFGKRHSLASRKKISKARSKYKNERERRIGRAEQMRKYKIKRRRVDIQYHLNVNLRRRFLLAIKGSFSGGQAVRDLGCSIPELMVYLEKQFQHGMTWKNWSFRGWHIDHIIPLDAFDLTKPKQVTKACHYTNLQPMWAVENLRKYNKVLCK